MPIFVHLERLLDERDLTLTELSRRMDLTVPNLSILKTGKARAIRFSTLEAICRELECQPGDLLEYIATGDAIRSRPGLTSQAVGIDEGSYDLEGS